MKIFHHGGTEYTENKKGVSSFEFQVSAKLASALQLRTGFAET
jgi:hypothetical protein